MKRIFILFLLLALCCNMQVFAAEDSSSSSSSDSENCEVKEDVYDRYTCRVASVCEQYRDNKVVYNTESYDQGDTFSDSSGKDAFLVSGRSEAGLKGAVKTYKNNMNSIYNCAMVGAQKNTVSLIRTRLFELDKT